MLKKPRGFTLPQVALVATLGVFGGIYIWKPLLIKFKIEKSTEAVEMSEPVTQSKKN